MSVVLERIAVLEETHNDCWIRHYSNGGNRGFYLAGTVFCASCPDRMLLPTDCRGTCVTGDCTSRYGHYCPCKYPPEEGRLEAFVDWAERHERIINSQREAGGHHKKRIAGFPGNRLTAEAISATVIA